MVKTVAPAPSGRGSFPNFFLVGAPRCGTTSMYTYLKQHPQIYLSVLKEPHFFSTDLTSPPQAVVDEDLYLSLFAGVEDEICVGEGSVWYLESHRAPEAIRDASPAARILIMLRQPVDMAFSLHGLYNRTGNEDILDFDGALAAQESRASGERIPPTAYFPEGLQYESVTQYSAKVERYFNHFGRDRVQVVIFEEMVADPARIYRQILKFLGVDPHFEAEFDRRRATGLIRTKVLQQLRTTAPEVRAKMRGGGRRHTVPRDRAVSAETRARMSELYAPDIAALSELLELDLSRWWTATKQLSRRAV